MVRVDASKKFQTIAGFGVLVPAHTEAQSSVYSHSFFETLVNDLGCNIIRAEFLTQDTETPDPEMLGIQLRDFNDLVSIKPDLKVLASINSPPSTMCGTSGRLNPESRMAFGKYLLDMCDTFGQHGCPIYGLGLQNGPTTAYSCEYNKEEYYEMFKVLCLLKSQRVSSVKLLATEDDSHATPMVAEFVDCINSDQTMRGYLDFLGVQGHMNISWGSLAELRRVNPMATLKDVYDHICSTFGNAVNPYGKDKWVVEACGEGTSWKVYRDFDRLITIRDPLYYCTIPTASMDLALKINSSMTCGNFSSYVYGFASTVPADGTFNTDLVDPKNTLCYLGIKSMKYQVAKHFYKYVLPGMTRIDASSDDIVSSAFMSDKIVVVLIHDGETIKESSVEFTGSNVSKFTSYSSVEKEYHHQESGSVVGNKIDVMMLPNSIITFVVE
jgi:O-glycosyl hydrolase